MSQPSRWGFARLARVAAAFAAALVIGAGRLTAQGTTGKIEGTVKDQSGAPIAGAQVLIVGSAFATTTNEQGYYFINLVPSGVLTVRSQYIGYAPAEVRNIRVFAGQTVTINIAMEQRAIEVGGITVTVEQNPIVPRDQVTSKPIVSGDLINDLPVDNAAAVLALQPGVVSARGGISIRGGRVGEEITYIDGVPVRSTSGNTSSIAVGTNAVEEVSVTTGAIGATQGDAQSGVVSYVTRSGSSRYTGYLSFATDEVAGQKYGQGLNRLEASFGGPIFGNLTFFLSTTMSGVQSPLRAKGSDEIPIYVLNGTDTVVTVANNPGRPTSDSTVVSLPAFVRYSDGMRRPDNWSSNWNVDAKLQYSYGTGSRVSATYHRTRGQGLNYRGNSLYNPMAQTGFINLANALILNWTQNLARSSERALFLDASLSYQSEANQGGLVDPTWYNDHRAPFAWFTLSDVPLVYNLDNFPVDDRLLQNIRVQNCQQGRDAERPELGGCTPLYQRNDLTQGGPFRTNPYGVTAGPSYFPSTGVGNQGVNLASENRWVGRANVDWQADRFNRFQFGGDFVKSSSKNYFASLVNLSFMDASIYQPYRYGLYATDRLDLGDVVLDLGLRYDAFNSDLAYPRTPGRVFTDPAREGRYNGSRTAEDSAVVESCSDYLAAADTAGWSTCNYFDGKSHSVLLPSLRVSFPITDRTGFRLSYAQQAQTPDFSLLANAVNTDISLSNTNDIFARDLDYGKTILFEFGIRHAFSSDMVLDVSAYNKDKVSDVTTRISPLWDPFRSETQNVNLMTNEDFGNVRGIDVKFDTRVGSIFQGSVAYTFQMAKSTGSDPFEYIQGASRVVSNITGDRAPPPQAALTTSDNRTHTIAGSLALSLPHGWHQGSTLGTVLQDFGAFATFRFASGLRYTRQINQGFGFRGPGTNFGLSGLGAEPINASEMPWIKNVDLRLTKGFRVGGTRDLTVFADFRNLFNWTNLAGIFAETGDVVNEVYRTRVIDPVRVTLAQEAGSTYINRVVDGVLESGIQLADCGLYQPTSSSGIPNCIMLRRAEARYGDGDQFFSDAEQATAFNAWYDLTQGQWTFNSPGMTFRLGFEFNF